MKIELNAYNWKVTEFPSCLPNHLQPEEYDGIHGEGPITYYYPLYFPVGLLIQYAQEHGYKLEIIY